MLNRVKGWSRTDRRALGARPTALLLSVGLIVGSAGVAAGVVPSPMVSGPITSPGSAFLTPPSTLDWTSYGYVEEEFFVAGTATAFTAPGALGGDGRWTASPGDSAPYVTRILVRRPENRKQFNGTTVVEWLNVSGGLDGAPDWTFAHTMLLRDGFAWVGVSAQRVGVEGGSSPLGLNLSLKAVNPARYGPLSHPGDTIARDAVGNALGGIRTPQVDVPIATLSGLGQSGGAFCPIFGTTSHFDAATLASLYPSHAAYVRAVLDATRKAVRAGFILRADATAIRAAAMASDIGR